jgi:cell division protein ZapA (FtsZ GTPase activity inhibitor)
MKIPKNTSYLEKEEKMKVQINIRGRVYHIRTEDDPQRVQQIAEDLNERLNTLAPNSRHVDEYAILVITALSILGEFKQKEEDMNHKVMELEQKVEQLINKIDQSLDQLDPSQNT